MPSLLRPVSTVPKFAYALLAIGLAAQMMWRAYHPLVPPQAGYLPQPPTLSLLQLASLGEPISLSKLVLLYLQTFDNQPGVKTPFHLLDYNRLQTWLDLTLQLDPQGQYPLFLASRIYGATGDEGKQRAMFDFVYRHFFAAPNQRWDALAFAAIMSKHRLKDLPLAHKYAQALYEHANEKSIPNWVKQLDIFILEDMQEYGAALALLNTIIQNDQITNPEELHFLLELRDKITAKDLITSAYGHNHGNS